MRQFIYLNNKWTVETSGFSSGIGAGTPPVEMTSFGVIFNCISDSTQGPYYGSIHHKNLSDETDDSLRESLSESIANSTQRSE